MTASMLLAFCLGWALPSRDVPFTPLVSGVHYLRDTTPETLVIRSKADEERFLKSHLFAGEPSFPKVDYAKKIVLGVVLGPQHTGAIRVSITRIEECGKSLLVHSVRTVPPPNAFVTEDIGYPVSLVSIEKTEKPVAFAPTEDRVREK